MPALPEILKKVIPATRPPKIVLLPDSVFFVRSVPVTVASPEETDSVTGQVELALEGLAPFPLTQLYYGYLWSPGEKQALVYASYRKRFTSEQVDQWEDAELVIPAFAALAGAKISTPSTVVLDTVESVTTLEWTQPNVQPEVVKAKAWPAELGEGDKALLRDELVRGLENERKMIETDQVPALDPEPENAEFVFNAGQVSAAYSRGQFDMMDVRDKEELGARRRARTRDLMLWRVFVGCAAALLLCGVVEIGLIGMKFWQGSREAKVKSQKPVVTKIENALNLANRIEELSTKRLQPFEMLTLLDSKRPGSVVFLRTTTSGLYTIEIEGVANTPSDLSVYQTALKQMPEFESVDLRSNGVSQGISSFTLTVTFKSEAFR